MNFLCHWNKYPHAYLWCGRLLRPNSYASVVRNQLQSVELPNEKKTLVGKYEICACVRVWMQSWKRMLADILKLMNTIHSNGFETKYVFVNSTPLVAMTRWMSLLSSSNRFLQSTQYFWDNWWIHLLTGLIELPKSNVFHFFCCTCPFISNKKDSQSYCSRRSRLVLPILNVSLKF